MIHGDGRRQIQHAVDPARRHEDQLPGGLQHGERGDGGGFLRAGFRAAVELVDVLAGADEVMDVRPAWELGGTKLRFRVEEHPQLFSAQVRGPGVGREHVEVQIGERILLARVDEPEVLLLCFMLWGKFSSVLCGGCCGGPRSFSPVHTLLVLVGREPRSASARRAVRPRSFSPAVHALLPRGGGSRAHQPIQPVERPGPQKHRQIILQTQLGLCVPVLEIAGSFRGSREELFYCEGPLLLLERARWGCAAVGGRRRFGLAPIPVRRSDNHNAMQTCYAT